MTRSSNISGFTLIEVVTAIGIFTIIAGAVSLFESNIFSYNGSASGSFATVQDAQVILKIISRDIRMASQGSDGSYAIQIAATNTLQFFSDVNGDGLKERIRYSLSGQKLYRTILVPTGSPLTYSGVESTSTILNNVVNDASLPVFSYFDGSYLGSTTGALAQPVSPSAIRLIQVSLKLDADPKHQVSARTYVAAVALRNLKDNL